MTEGTPWGLLRGLGKSGAMDIATPELRAPPVRGDFAVVPAGDRVLVLRIVSAQSAGSFAEASDRGAEYLAQIARAGGEVPARVRELLLRFRVEATPLGWVIHDGAERRFEAGVRATQLFGHPVYAPSRDLLEFLVNVGVGPDAVPIGKYARGHEVVDVPVRFSMRQLDARRTVVFARAGYGKSNLTKVLLSRVGRSLGGTGLLIVDPEGEYAFGHDSAAGYVPGLADDPALRARLRVFTNRRIKPDPRWSCVGGRLELDLGKLSPGEFLGAFVPEEKVTGVWANLLRSCSRTAWSDLIRLLAEQKFSAPDEEIGGLVHRKPKRENDVSIDAIRNNLVPVIERFHNPRSNLLEDVSNTAMGRNRPPGIVVLDVSMLEAADADALTRIVLQRLFHDAVQAIDDRKRHVLLVIEEAQTVLGRAHDDRDIDVRWVKEGRKYGLGAMLVTQQPGALAPEITSQADNYFVMHLLAERDLDALGSANAHYGADVRGFLRDEPVKGNCYVWSSEQPYVVPVRIDNHEAPSPIGAPEAPERPVPATPYEERLRAGLFAALRAPRVWTYEVATLDGAQGDGRVAVAVNYLAAAVEGARELREERPDDWEVRWTMLVLRDGPLFAALRGVALDGLRWGTVEGRFRGMVVLDRAALQRLGVGVGDPREPVDLRSRGPAAAP